MKTFYYNILLWLLCLIGLFPQLQAQVTTFSDNFDDNQLSTNWQFVHETYTGSETNGVLNVEYDRTATSWEWDQFTLQLPSIDISENPFIILKIRSDIAFNLVLKPENSLGGSDWIETSISGDNEWQELYLEVVTAQSNPINNVYIYFDAGSTAIKNGIVQIDDFSVGAAVEIPINTNLLQQAITDANNLYSFSEEGELEGQFAIGSRDILLQAIITAQANLDNTDLINTQNIADELAYALYDQCTDFEKKAVSDFAYPAVDAQSTYNTQTVLSNLHALKGPRFLYGMQDATGYGVNWSGDDDRSDVKDVTGSYPALFSWEVNEITRRQGIDRLTYRIKNAHELGGVNTLCWHQYDPSGVSFYFDEVTNPSSIMRSLLPNGANNEGYQDKLKAIANYCKSLRDSKGRTIPILFRPYHEHNGWWFWWGSSSGTDADYVDLWRYTVDYFRDEMNIHSFIYVFSPDGQHIDTNKPYLYRYPGDDYVDILGYDFYFGNGTTTEINRFIDFISDAANLANSKNKVAAVTEVGDRKDWDNDDQLEIDKWHTRAILDPIKNNELASQIAYLATWRNASTNHHFAPYPGHEAVPDFLKFYSDTTTIFLNNMVQGISDSLYTNKLNEPSDAAFLHRYVVNNSIVGNIDGTDVSLEGVLNFNYNNTRPVFEYSMNGNIELLGEPQTSGDNTVDLSEVLVYTITSENEEVTRDYFVELKLETSVQMPLVPTFEIDIYPLPARDFVKIESNEHLKNVQLFNMNGQEIGIPSSINGTIARLDLTQVMAGHYTLMLTNNENIIASRKLVVH